MRRTNRQEQRSRSRRDITVRRFDYSFLNNGKLSTNLLNLTANIYSLKTMAGVRKDEYAKIFTELESVAKIQSIKSSNAIEGILTSDERIHAIVNQNSAPLNHDEQEIAGYRDALSNIHAGFAFLDFRERDILLLHQTMLSPSGQNVGGSYKTADNVILEIDASGNRRVRFQPTSARETPEASANAGRAQHTSSAAAASRQMSFFMCFPPLFWFARYGKANTANSITQYARRKQRELAK